MKSGDDDVYSSHTLNWTERARLKRNYWGRQRKAAIKWTDSIVWLNVTAHNFCTSARGESLCLVFWFGHTTKSKPSVKIFLWKESRWIVVLHRGHKLKPPMSWLCNVAPCWTLRRALLDRLSGNVVTFSLYITTEVCTCLKVFLCLGEWELSSYANK